MRTREKFYSSTTQANYEDPWFYRPIESDRQRMEPWRDNRGKAPRGYKRSDQRIMEDIFQAVTGDLMLDSSDVEINVTDGEVVLSGYVRDRRDRRRLEDRIENIRGVINVENRIRINPQASAFDRRNAGYGSNTNSQLRSFVQDISDR